MSSPHNPAILDPLLVLIREDEAYMLRPNNSLEPLVEQPTCEMKRKSLLNVLPTTKVL